MTLFGPFADVPAYPLVFPLFWGAVVFFVLAMARHLRVFAAVRAEGPSPFADIPRRFVGLIQYAFIQTKMFKDARAGLMHAGIFWGFVLLTIGTANVVTGGIIEQVLSIPFDGLLWTLVSAMQNVVAVIVLVSIGWAFFRRLVTKPRRLTFNRDALVILSMIGGVVRPSCWPRRSSSRPTATSPARSCRPRWPVRCAARSHPRPSQPGSRSCGGRTSSLVAAFLVLPAVLQAPPHRHELPEHLVPQARAARRAAEDGPRGRERDVRPQDAAGPRLEGPARRLHVHRMRPLPGGLPAHGTRGSRSTPRPSSWASGTCRSRPRTGLNLIPNSPIVRETYGLDDSRPAATALAEPIVDDAIPYDAVWDCVTCGACVEACPVLIEHVDKIVGLRRNLVLEESRFPQELTAGLPGDGGPGQPVGPAGLDAARLDEAAAVRGADRRGRRRGRRARRPRGPVLGRLCGGVRSAQPEGRPGGRDVPPCRRRLVRRPRPGGVVHRRPGPADGQRLRLPDPGVGARSRR